MTAYLAGVATVLALLLAVKIDHGLAADPYNGGPLYRLFDRLRHQLWWNGAYKRAQRREATRQWIVTMAPIAALLRRRQWHVLAWNHCVVGPEHGWKPYISHESWHWTRRGAEWHRHHRVRHKGFVGSSYTVTELHRQSECDVAQGGACARSAA